MSNFLKEYPSDDNMSYAKTLDIEKLDAWVDAVDDSLGCIEKRMNSFEPNVANCISDLNARIDIVKNDIDTIMKKLDITENGCTDSFSIKSMWTKCDDVLPNVGDTVLVCRKSLFGEHYVYCVATLNYSPDGFDVSDDKGTTYRVKTAWRSRDGYRATYFYAGWCPIPKYDVKG
jgi:hypothetical protein